MCTGGTSGRSRERGIQQRCATKGDRRDRYQRCLAQRDHESDLTTKHSNRIGRESRTSVGKIRVSASAYSNKRCPLLPYGHPVQKKPCVSQPWNAETLGHWCWPVERVADCKVSPGTYRESRFRSSSVHCMAGRVCSRRRCNAPRLLCKPTEFARSSPHSTDNGGPGLAAWIFHAIFAARK